MTGALAVWVAATAATPVLAQGSTNRSAGPTAAQLAERLTAMSAISGYEQAMVDSLLALVPGARRDRAGSAVVTLGRGAPRRLVTCPIDEPGFVVGGVRADGWLTLRRVGRSAAPLFDQQLEGQRVVLAGRRGPVPGVVAVRSVHLTRGRGGPAGDPPFTVDDALVDVGAVNAAGVDSLGVGVLTPVALEKRPHRYGEGRALLAAPMAGRRAACAALVRALREAPRPRGTVVAAFVVELQLGGRGLQTAMTVAAATDGAFDEVLVVDGGVAPAEAADVADSAGIRRWVLPARHVGTPVESVALAEADRFAARLAAWIGGGR